jgi:hypothetical protein
MKTLLTSALIIATISLGAQEKKMKKACIQMESEENGKVTKIDTCVTAATDEELQEKLNALGFGGGGDIPPVPPVPPIPPLPPLPPDLPSINIEIDSVPGSNGYSYTYTKVITIDDGEEESSSGKRHSKKKTMKVRSNTGSESNAQVFIMDDDGNVITTDGKAGPGNGNAKVIVKTLKPGEKLDPETEKILKEHGIEKMNGNSQQIIIKNSESKDGKKSNEVKVFVFSKMEVKKLSDAEKKQLPPDASKAIQNAKSFDNLSVAPNPTEDACTITYKSVSKEPLQIKVYDTQGKTVLTETDSDVGEQVNKTLSLKNLGQGVYFVHLTQGKQSEVRKVIVK